MSDDNLRTDDLIRALAADSAAPRAGLAPALLLSALAALLVSFVTLLGTAGIQAAIANAVYDAIGKRVRKLPIRIEDCLAATARP